MADENQPQDQGSQQPGQQSDRDQQPTRQQPVAQPQIINPVPQAQPAPAGASAPGSDVPAADAPAGESKPRKPLGMGAAVAIALVAAIVGAGGLYAILDLTGALDGGTVVVSSSEKSSAGKTITINASSEDATIAEAVSAKALPSVCSIHVESATETGVGSGVVLDTDGNILTNYHVIEDADTISVTLGDETYDASVVGYDVDSDLAVVSIDADADDLTPIEVGDSDELVVGDWVMAIGSPYGLDQSVSSGIVSSLYRSTMLSSTGGSTIYANLIQTDAAINPGNSGGALVNDQGQLVGINALAASYSGSSAGVGFAIPGNYAVSVAKTLIAGDEVEHPYIGVSVQTTTSRDSSGDSDADQGAYVASVTEGGPAAEAGLEVGDVITKVDDESISSADALILAIRSHEVGDVVELTIVRDGKTTVIEVELDGKTDSETGANSDSSADDRGSIHGGQGQQTPGQNSYASGTIELDGASCEVSAARQSDDVAASGEELAA